MRKPQLPLCRVFTLQICHQLFLQAAHHVALNDAINRSDRDDRKRNEAGLPDGRCDLQVLGGLDQRHRTVTTTWRSAKPAISAGE
jgi:hypothetical protein